MAETERFERSQALARHLSGVLPYQLGDASRMETQLSKIKKSELRFRLWNPPALDSRLLVLFLEIQERESAPAALGSITL